MIRRKQTQWTPVRGSHIAAALGTGLTRVLLVGIAGALLSVPVNVFWFAILVMAISTFSWEVNDGRK